MKRSFIYLSLFLPLFLFTHCGGDGNKSSNDTEEDSGLEELLQEETENKIEIQPEMVKGLISSIPSPVETSILIQETGGKYNKDLLNPADNSGNYNTNNKKALNLGVYSTDLGFTNIYNETQDAISYITAVREQADGLGIGEYFDMETIARLAENSDNLDSLLMVSIRNFQNINDKLQEKGRPELSVLIILGGWIEGLHLTCQILNETPNDKLKERVGEQKIVLEQLMYLVSLLRDNPEMSGIISDMDLLKTKYEAITIEKTILGTEMIEIDGVPTFVDKSITTVYITDEQLKEITDIFARMRSKVIKV